MPAPDVQLDDVTTILDNTTVLDRLGLFVPAGKITVLMGPSGVGKTTLIKHVLGLLEPTAGTVRIGGQDLFAATPEQRREIRGGIGAMLGGHNLYDTSVFGSLSVLDNLTYTLRARGVPESQGHDRAMATLRELGLVEAEALLPEELSAHARKRLALARALVLDAPLTVLDEIDVGLDRDYAAAMLDAVRNLHARTGATLLVTTHTIELARSLADRLAILVRGRIVAVGSPIDLLDGVRTSEDFDRRFDFSDYSGPPRLTDAEAAAVRPAPTVVRTSGPGSDRTVVWLAVLAAALLLALFLAVRLVSGGASP